LIPEDSETGNHRRIDFAGIFLDLRTLAFALTDRGYSLESACEAFGVVHAKKSAGQHGIVTDDYIAYNLRDCLATSELADKLLEEYDKHPITLQPTKAYSPASIGKAYLRSMGIKPVLERQPDFRANISAAPRNRHLLGGGPARVRKCGPGCLYRFPFDVRAVNRLMNVEICYRQENSSSTPRPRSRNFSRLNDETLFHADAETITALSGSSRI
jgi:hypothetical protein